MRTNRLPTLILISTVATTAISSLALAHASEPSDQDITYRNAPRRFRIELLGGVGFGGTKISTGESINPYGGGVTLRGGYVFPWRAYVGGRYDHFFGTTSSYSYPPVAAIEHRARAGFLAIDLGYDLPLPGAFARPHLGIGAGMLTRDVTCSPDPGGYGGLSAQVCDPSTSSGQLGTVWHLALIPGLSMGLRTQRWVVLVEPRYYVLHEANAYAIFGGVGYIP